LLFFLILTLQLHCIWWSHELSTFLFIQKWQQSTDINMDSTNAGGYLWCLMPLSRVFQSTHRKPLTWILVLYSLGKYKETFWLPTDISYFFQENWQKHRYFFLASNQLTIRIHWSCICTGGHRGHDRMVVRFTTTCAIISVIKTFLYIYLDYTKQESDFKSTYPKIAKNNVR
jgi:hypothetical protein